MIFSKDDTMDQLPYTPSQRFNKIKVIVSCLFVMLSIFLYLCGYDTILGVTLVVFGIIWNFYLPLNSPLSLTFSALVGIVYSLICISVGLYANAFLYLAFYIPMQYNALKIDDTFILEKKKLSQYEAVFTLVYYCVFFVSIYVLCISINNTLLCFIDSISATLLALSSMLRNLRTSEYYLFRFIALSVSIFMWALIVSGSAVVGGSVGALVMYCMYFVYEVVEIIYHKRHYVDLDVLKNELLETQKMKQLAETKKAQINKT